MLNVAVLMGRLVADPELRTTPNGISVTSFTVAVERDYVTSGQQRQADFIDVVAWRKTAEFISKYFHKGSMIAVQGSIQTRMYEDKNGNKRKAVEIVADSVSFTGSKAETGTGNYGNNNNNYGGGYGDNGGYNNNGYNNNSYGNNSYNNNNNSYQRSSQPSAAPIYSSGSDNDFQDMSDMRDDDLPF